MHKDCYTYVQCTVVHNLDMSGIFDECAQQLSFYMALRNRSPFVKDVSSLFFLSINIGYSTSSYTSEITFFFRY